VIFSNTNGSHPDLKKSIKMIPGTLLSRKWLVFILSLFLVASGCATKKARKIDEMGHAELLEKGLSQLKKSDYANALANLQMVKNRYPYTDSAIVASLKLADTYYELGEYESAYDMYNEFERYHPKDENIPYVKYRKGMCYFTRIKGFDQEQTHAQKAMLEFERLIAQHPENEYSKQARRHLRTCLINLAHFELYTGNFYYRQKDYRAALQRYQFALKSYPDVGHYYEAINMISLCNMKIAEQEKRAANQ
jgi:outer membrane protein assembly factor BamD